MSETRAITRSKKTNIQLASLITAINNECSSLKDLTGLRGSLMSERNDMDQLLAGTGLHVYRTLLGASASVIRKTQLQQSTDILMLILL
jgi:hypothetical protein